jgi:tyrosine-protein kinase Etk/Wzc
MNTQQNNTQNPFGNEDDDLYLVKDIFRKYLRIWHLVGLSLFIFLFAAYLVNRFERPVYKSTAQFFVKEQESGMNLFDQRFLGYNSELDMTNQMIIMRSRPIAERALNKLNFQVEYHIDGIVRSGETYHFSPVTAEIDWKHPQLV